jgi:hypothetical protein
MLQYSNLKVSKALVFAHIKQDKFHARANVSSLIIPKMWRVISYKRWNLEEDQDSLYEGVLLLIRSTWGWNAETRRIMTQKQRWRMLSFKVETPTSKIRDEEKDETPPLNTRERQPIVPPHCQLYRVKKRSDGENMCVTTWEEHTK